MLGFTAAAARQVVELRAFYEHKERPDAVRNLRVALQRASNRIERTPDAGLPGPRPYPELARAGERWVKEGRYWITYSVTDPPVIVGVFYETADMPSRV